MRLLALVVLTTTTLEHSSDASSVISYSGGSSHRSKWASKHFLYICVHPRVFCVSSVTLQSFCKPSVDQTHAHVEIFPNQLFSIVHNLSFVLLT